MRRLAFGLLFVGLAGLAGCGIPADHAAHSFVVVQAGAPPATSPGPLRPISVYFVKNGKLVSVTRQIATSSSEEAEEALVLLLAGPNAAERKAGITTAITGPAATSVTGPPVQGVVTVALDPVFVAIRPQSPLLYEAYGQVVYTLTAPALGATKVKFVAGTRIWPLVFEPSPITSGPTAGSGATVSSGIVSRANYCEIASSGCAGLGPPATTGDGAP